MLKQYVQFLFPGLIVSNISTRPVPDRQAISDLPVGAYGYRFFDREEIMQGDEWLLGKEKNYSPYIYFGEALTVEDVERLNGGDARLSGEYRILLSNMRGNGYSRVVRTIRGSFHPLNKGDVVINERL